MFENPLLLLIKEMKLAFDLFALQNKIPENVCTWVLGSIKSMIHIKT